MSPYRRTAAEVDADLMAAHSLRLERDRLALLDAAQEVSAGGALDSDGYLLPPLSAQRLAAVFRIAASSFRMPLAGAVIELAESLVVDENDPLFTEEADRG